MKTIIEKSPDAAPDEEERIIAERGKLIPQEAAMDAEKAQNMSVNRSDEIVDNQASTGMS
jgi:ribulose 1,5-bisphosphate synthetase/thiazole synthase